MKVGAGQTYPTISDAVTNLPSSLGGRTCIVIEDGATYGEQVTVRNIANNGYSLDIFADPLNGFRPVINPPPTSTAAFVIANATMNISGINIIPGSAITYAINASSSYVTISSIIPTMEMTPPARKISQGRGPGFNRKNPARQAAMMKRCAATAAVCSAMSDRNTRPVSSAVMSAQAPTMRP